MAGTLRIVIADDHEVVRKGVRRLLEQRHGWDICGEASDGEEAVAKVAELQPDIVLLDIAMPKLNGLDAAKRFLEEFPRTRVLFLTVHESDQVLQEILETGARGFVTKSDLARDLVSAVEAVQRHQTFFSPVFARVMLNDQLLQPAARRHLGRDRLTNREREVVRLLGEGKTSKEVADQLNVSVKTAETHRANVMRKLDVHSTADLVRYALRNGILQA